MSNRIEDLEPVTRALCEQFLAHAEARGHALRITHTLRTMEEQAKLYAQGRTAPGKIVTRAMPGQSAHNYGMAFDVCFKGTTPYPEDALGLAWWGEIGAVGKKLGLVWGGDFKKLKDRPHFERADWRVAAGLV